MLSNPPFRIHGVADVSPAFEFWIQAVQQIAPVEFLHFFHIVYKRALLLVFSTKGKFIEQGNISLDERSN